MSLSFAARWFVVVTLLLTVRLFADTAKFSEKYADKALTMKEDGETFCEQIATGSYTFSGVFFVAEPLAAADFDAETEVTIQIGNVEHTVYLGDDPKYVDGAAKATIVLYTEQCKETKDDFVCKDLKYVTIKIAFTAKGVKISVAGKTGTDKYFTELDSSPLAEGFAFENSPFGADMDVFIGIGGNELFAMMNVAGVSKVKMGHNKCGDDTELATVSVKGTALNIEE